MFYMPKSIVSKKVIPEHLFLALKKLEKEYCNRQIEKSLKWSTHKDDIPARANFVFLPLNGTNSTKSSICAQNHHLILGFVAGVALRGARRPL